MPNVYHLLFLVLLAGPWIILIILARKSERTGTEMPKPAFIVNMAVLYALSYNVVFFLQELFLALGKRWLGLTAYLYHNNHSWDGSHPMTDLAQGYGALAILLFAVMCAGWLFTWNPKGAFHYFLIWLVYHGFAQSMPQIATGVVAPNTDVGRAMAYLQWPEPALLLASIASLSLLILVSVLLGKNFHESSGSDGMQPLLNPYAVVGIPALLGIVLIVPFRLMPWSQVISPILVTLVGVPWMLVGMKKATENSINLILGEKVLWVPVVLLVLLLVIFQGILSRGVVL